MSLADDELIQRFLVSDEASPIAYLALRRLEARNEPFHTDGWLDACAELSPENVFRCRVIAEGGSGLIRGRVLKNALENEREAWTNGEIDRSTLGLANLRVPDDRRHRRRHAHRDSQATSRGPDARQRRHVPQTSCR